MDANLFFPKKITDYTDDTKPIGKVLSNIQDSERETIKNFLSELSEAMENF